MLNLVVGILLSVRAGTGLPADCNPVEDHFLDTFDPRGTFGVTREIANKQPPRWTGSLRNTRPLPTHHFVTSQLKSVGSEAMVLWPYFSEMDQSGIVYDPIEFRRFTDPERTIYADGQSMWKDGEPWHRLLSLGTNMFQKVSGPDGNPLGNFNGKSGVRIGINGNSDPVLEDFGDLFANFRYTGSGGGSMEVPLVRGSILLTHIFNNANPVVTPYCLSSINGEQHTFDCPIAPASNDGGSGYLSATCTGSTLTIYLKNTRPIKDMSLVQYAANTVGAYPGSHPMRNCDDQACKLLDGGYTVEIVVPNAHATMAFAVNYIGHYILPPAWTSHPQETTCGGGGRKRAVADISVHASCDADNMVNIVVDLAGEVITGISKIQYSLSASTDWPVHPPMFNCDPSTCSMTGGIVTIRKNVGSQHVKFAVNVIGYIVIPYQNWQQSPLELICGSGHDVHVGGTTHHVTQPPILQPSTGSNTFTTAGHQTSANPSPDKKFILELNEPGHSLPGQTRKFVLYFSEEVRAQVHQGTNEITFSPKAGGNYNGIVQLAYIGSGPRGDHSNGTVYDQNAGVYSYKPTTSFCVSESTGSAHALFRWNPNNRYAASPTSDLLMQLMPHHAYILQNEYSGQITSTPFGFHGYRGAEWDLKMDAPRASMMPDPTEVARLTAAQKQDIVAAIERDSQNTNLDQICAHSDSYNVGKAIGLVARLASISRVMGTNHYQALDTSVKNCLEQWLRIQDTLQDKWKLHYDEVWGGLFLRATDSPDIAFGTDYGFPYYNDHHFHLGYFLYAMAYYVQHNPSWGQANRHRLLAVARDVSNPNPRDPYFPTVRHKDMYTGFSWASGLVPGSRQEESASESLNCYHGVAALGDALNDPVLKHMGQVMLAMELLSVREYWQVRSHNRQQFPPIIQETGVCGQIAEDSFYVYTLDWPCDPNRFPMRHACLVGIQVIPITAVSKYWMDQEWAQSIQHSCTSAIHPEQEPAYTIADPHEKRDLNSGWKAFCLAAMAPLDAQHQNEAANYVRDKRPQDLVGGTGAASTLMFIYAST